MTNEMIINILKNMYECESKTCDYDCENCPHNHTQEDTKNALMLAIGIIQSLDDGCIVFKNNILKEVTKDYVIYNRDWLVKNIDMEVDLIKNYGEWKVKGIKPFSKEEFENECSLNILHK